MALTRHDEVRQRIAGRRRTDQSWQRGSGDHRVKCASRHPVRDDGAAWLLLHGGRLSSGAAETESRSTEQSGTWWFAAVRAVESGVREVQNDHIDTHIAL